MPVSQTDATLVIEIVYGEAPRHFDPAEMGAAKRILSLPGMSTKKVSLLMAIVSSSQHWAPIIVNVQKLELHLEKMLDLLARDPSAPGNRPLGGADGYQADTSEGQHENAETLEATFAQKQAAERKPWEDLWHEATKVHGLVGASASRWCFREFNRRHVKPGDSPRDFDKTMKAFGVASHARASLPAQRGAIEPHRAADSATPKRPQYEEPARVWRDAEDGDE